MGPHEPQYAWLLWSLLLVGIWALIYVFFKNREGRREMLVVNAWTSLLWSSVYEHVAWRKLK